VNQWPDFLFPDHHGGVWMLECKTSKTSLPSMAAPLLSLRRTMDIGQREVRSAIVHPVSKSAPALRALVPGVEVLTTDALAAALTGAKKS
jgi:hypothetical protein